MTAWELVEMTLILLSSSSQSIKYSLPRRTATANRRCHSHLQPSNKMFGQENMSATEQSSQVSAGRSSARAALTSPPVPQAARSFFPRNASTFAALMPMLPTIPPANAAARLAPTASCPAVAPRAFPQYDAAWYPGIAETAAALEDVMARWKTMPGPVEWCGTSFNKICLGVCMQMVVNKVHLQQKRGAKGQAWKNFYKQNIGIRAG
jgi:hypothetical protein